MEAVTLKPLFHKGAECIGIYSRQNATLNHYYQKKAGAKWSRTNKCWYVPCNEKNYDQLCKALSGIATLDVAELKTYLLQKKKGKGSIPVLIHKTPAQPVAARAAAPQLRQTVQSKPLCKLSKENGDALQKFKLQLVLKSYSPSTIRTIQTSLCNFYKR